MEMKKKMDREEWGGALAPLWSTNGICWILELEHHPLGVRFQWKLWWRGRWRRRGRRRWRRRERWRRRRRGGGGGGGDGDGGGGGGRGVRAWALHPYLTKRWSPYMFIGPAIVFNKVSGGSGFLIGWALIYYLAEISPKLHGNEEN